MERILIDYRFNRAKAALLRARLERAGGSIVLRESRGAGGREDALAALADVTSQLDDFKLVMAALKRIEREFVRLRYVEGLPMRAVARALGRSERAMYHMRLRVLQKGAAVLGLQRNCS